VAVAEGVVVEHEGFVFDCWHEDIVAD
jgi:hypothetical protein